MCFHGLSSSYMPLFLLHFENWDLFWQHYLDKTTFANKTRRLTRKKKNMAIFFGRVPQVHLLGRVLLTCNKQFAYQSQYTYQVSIQSLTSLCPPVLNYHITHFPHSWSVPLLKIFAVFIGCWQRDIQTSGDISFLTSPDSDTMWDFIKVVFPLSVVNSSFA